MICNKEGVELKITRKEYTLTPSANSTVANETSQVFKTWALQDITADVEKYGDIISVTGYGRGGIPTIVSFDYSNGWRIKALQYKDYTLDITVYVTFATVVYKV